MQILRLNRQMIVMKAGGVGTHDSKIIRLTGDATDTRQRFSQASLQPLLVTRIDRIDRPRMIDPDDLVNGMEVLLRVFAPISITCRRVNARDAAGYQQACKQ